MGAFLTAEWRNLVMMNYVVPEQVLKPHLPNGVELDVYNGKCYVSFVAFHFLDTKLKGIAIPYHKDFEEINLRFYVRYPSKEGVKRGVVFIKELVPKRMIAWVAKLVYGERYAYTPIKSKIEQTNLRYLQFEWGKEQEHHLKVETAAHVLPIQRGSKEEFIFEHYLGYTSLSTFRTGEYKVEHPRWNVYPVNGFSYTIDFEKLYGDDFAFMNDMQPDSVFVAEGSEVSVHERKML
ncbi:DUF2071 domain-containing protein [Lacibacter luteus]|uniref:DUF2071 domain-containing protein n=1 Tax=Lacibacter luteus TaxID=2508719 RepID=A0A4Q1CML5_9BACT|nr:DUF2071 domain-containing protein [Lacibacter luteus]RXK61859.1 DUF2071 domain-containing protein [Lacibacter luteus]